jgi:DNA polymerase-3 subunit gamma/tau
VSYTVFARKYRPQTFAEVVGQEHITRTLKNAIEQNRLAHAYIFIGPRGTGKTSIARILAKALNCVHGPTVTPCGVCDICREIAAGTSLDVLEFDAASNTQVDKIREIIIDNVKYAPARGRFKLYIVDEVHMLSASSFNALLKTLEEPPAHVKFVFATTNVEKVPTTILSRCQRFDLKRIPVPLIKQHLLDIAGKENVRLSSPAAETLARGAEGGMRDAESMLDQLVAFCGDPIDEADVLKIFGFTARETVSALCDDLIEGNMPAALARVHAQSEAGKDLGRLMADLISHLRDLLVAKADPDGMREELGAEAVETLTRQAARLEMDRLLDLIEQFAAAETRIKWAQNKKMHLEIAIIRAVQSLAQTSLNEVLEALSSLREGSSGPTKSPSPPPAKPRTDGAKEPAAGPRAESAAPTRPAATDVTPARPANPVETPVAETMPPPTSMSATPPPARSVEEIWAEVLRAVQTARPLISGWMHSLALLEISGEIAVIGYAPDNAIAAESCQLPGNRKFIEELIEKIAGRRVALRFVQRDDLPGAPLPEAPEVRVEAARDPMEEFKRDPLIKKALEMFKAQIQPAGGNLV